MNEWEIWSEGYSATGEHSPAYYHGKSKGETFIEACENFRYDEDFKAEWGGIVVKRKGKPLGLDRNSDGSLRLSHDGSPMIWACHLYDNEADARKSFG